MAQQAWSITGHYGNTYKLGLFHGEKTHHVVVHCNNNIVAIDFGVKESKKYTIFLDQQLCEVSIDHTGGENFTYDCRINYDVETPPAEKATGGGGQIRTDSAFCRGGYFGDYCCLSYWVTFRGRERGCKGRF
jgi:hypothetical protein